MKYCKCNKKNKREEVSFENQYPGNLTLSTLNTFITYPEDNQFINGILWGTKWKNLPNNEFTYTINWGNSSKNSIIENGVTLEFIEPTTETRNSVIQSMNDLAEFIHRNVRYVEEVNDTILSFNFIPSSKISFLGYAIPPNPTLRDNNVDQFDDTPGNIFIGYNTSMNFQKGSYNYITIVHELGHALGLAHPHDTGGNSSIYDGVTSSFGDFGTYNANLQPLTIMTYNDIDSPYVPNTNSTTGFLATFGPIDIVALQFLYGKNENFNSGNNIYSFPNSSTQKFWETIWDSGGINTIDTSNTNVNNVIHLNDATINNNTNLAGTSLSYNIFGGITIAKGTEIQNIITGSKNDTITGNELDNEITITEGGNDIIDGKGGYDTIIINNNSDLFSITENNGEVIIAKIEQKITLKNCEKIIFNDKEYVIENINPLPNPIKLSDISSFGRININHNWKTISFGKSFQNPVIILSDPTLKGGDPIITRIRNITSTSCQVRLKEPNYKDGQHTYETISYLIGEKGSYIIEDKKIEFGLQTGVGKDFKTISFSSSYPSTPSIFTQVQTKNNSDWIITRNRALNQKSFQVKLQKEERRLSTSYKNEIIGWMSITQGKSNDNSSKFESKIISGVTHRNKRINYQSSFSSTPFLITKVVTYSGGNPCNTRIIRNSLTYFDIKIYEEQSRDKEMNHGNENISYLAIL